MQDVSGQRGSVLSDASNLAVFPFGCLKIVQITKFRTHLDLTVSRYNV